jgi:hypothetical protein
VLLKGRIHEVRRCDGIVWHDMYLPSVMYVGLVFELLGVDLFIGTYQHSTYLFPLNMESDLVVRVWSQGAQSHYKKVIIMKKWAGYCQYMKLQYMVFCADKFHSMSLVKTDVSEESIASIIRVTRFGELGTSGLTSNRSTLQKIPCLHLVTLMMEVILSPKRQFLQEPYGVISQQTAFFILNAAKTSNLTNFTCSFPAPRKFSWRNNPKNILDYLYF